MPTPSYAAETERVAAHILRAERVAHARDLKRLSPAQRLVRSLLLRELKDYRLRKRFPTNPRFAEPTPTFVDAAGAPCAVAHLLRASGEHELVKRVARERNHARVRELTNEPALVAWLSAAGLTVEEAARIQPSYEIYNGACLCGHDWSGLEPLSGTSPADGVLVGTASDVTYGMQRMQITETYGDASPYTIGQEIAVDIRAYDVVSTNARLVVPVHLGDATTSIDGGEAVLTAVMLDEDGTYSCNDYGSELGPLTENQLADVLRAPDCDKALKDINPDFVRRYRDDSGSIGAGSDGCALSADSVPDTPATVGILLVLAATVARRRYKR